MRYQVQRKIKGCDSCDRPERKSTDDSPAAGGVLLPVERQVLPVNPGALFGRNREGKDGALDFGPSLLDGLSGFLTKSAGELFLSFGDAFRNAPQDALTFESWQAARRAKRLYRGCDGR